MQREKERDNVGNCISPNIITAIGAGLITVNIEGLHKRNKHFKKCMVWNEF